jgi:hypothetical protein
MAKYVDVRVSLDPFGNYGGVVRLPDPLPEQFFFVWLDRPPTADVRTGVARWVPLKQRRNYVAGADLLYYLYHPTDDTFPRWGNRPDYQT